MRSARKGATEQTIQTRSDLVRIARMRGRRAPAMQQNLEVTRAAKQKAAAKSQRAQAELREQAGVESRQKARLAECLAKIETAEQCRGLLGDVVLSLDERCASQEAAQHREVDEFGVACEVPRALHYRVADAEREENRLRAVSLTRLPVTTDSRAQSANTWREKGTDSESAGAKSAGRAST